MEVPIDMHTLITTIQQAVIDGHHKEIEALVRQAVEAGLPLEQIINESLIGAMDVVAQRFSRKEIFVPKCSWRP